MPNIETGHFAHHFLDIEAEVADEKDPDKQAGMCPSDKDHMAVVDRT